jgi:hypothetical protein
MRSSAVGAVVTVLAVAAVPAALLAAPLEALPYLSLVVVLGLPLYLAARWRLGGDPRLPRSDAKPEGRAAPAARSEPSEASPRS